MGRSPLPMASEYGLSSPRRRLPVPSEYSPKSPPKKRQDEVSNVSNVGETSSHHSLLVQTIAQKLKTKRKLTESQFEKSDVKPKSKQKTPSPPPPPDDKVSIAPSITASAMKPVTDDSLSVAMAASGSAITTVPK